MRPATGPRYPLKARLSLLFALTLVAALALALVLQLGAAQRHRDQLREALLSNLSDSWEAALSAIGLVGLRNPQALRQQTQAGASRGTGPQWAVTPGDRSRSRVDIVDLQGQVTASSVTPLPPAPLVELAAVETRLRHEPMVTTLIRADFPNSDELQILLALRLDDGQVLLATEPVTTLTPILDRGIEGSWLLSSQSGSILAGSLAAPLHPQMLTERQGTQSLRDLTVDGRVFEVIDLVLEDLYNKPVGLLSQAREVTHKRGLETQALTLTLGLGVGFIGLATLALYRRLAYELRPLSDLAGTVSRIAAGDLHSKVIVRNASQEVQAIGSAVGRLQHTARVAEQRDFRAQLDNTAELELLETSMSRLRSMLDTAEQSRLQADLQDADPHQRQLSHAFARMVDRVIEQHTRLSDLLGERERDLAVVRQALSERDQLARLREELEIARRLQLSNLPGEAAMRALAQPVDLYAVTLPAREVGGDFYDFAVVDDRHLILILGDASGKGVSAAMFGMMTRVLVKSAAHPEVDPGVSLARANGVLAQENDALLFATVFLGILDLQTGHLRYANAGHNPPLICPVSGKLRRLDAAPGLVLGALEESLYDSHETWLNRDELLVLYSDGLTEAHRTDRQLYGEERLGQCLGQQAGTTARGAVEALIGSVTAFSGDCPQFDDMTLMVTRIREGLGEEIRQETRQEVGDDRQTT